MLFSNLFNSILVRQGLLSQKDIVDINRRIVIATLVFVAFRNQPHGVHSQPGCCKELLSSVRLASCLLSKLLWARECLFCYGVTAC